MHVSFLVPLLLGLGFMLAAVMPSSAAADDRNRHARHNDHSTPHSRHEAIKRRHLNSFNSSRGVQRHHFEHRRYQHDRRSIRRHHQLRHSPRHHQGYRYYQHRRPHNGVSIGLPAIRININ